MWGLVGYGGPVRSLCRTGLCLALVDRVLVGGKLKELLRKRDSDKPRDRSFPAFVPGSGER